MTVTQPAQPATPALRLNQANWLTDQARALIAADVDGERAYELLVESVRTEPSLVNAFAALADWRRATGVDPYPELLRLWNEHGSGDLRTLRFVRQYRDGDPALALARWCEERGSRPAVIVSVGDDLSYLDLYDCHGAPGSPPVLVGRVYEPRLVCSPRDFGSLPAAKQAIAEDLIKRGKDHRIVSHRGTTVEIPHRTVFGPAIDSLHFNAVLHEIVYRSSAAAGATRVAEIGVGSGFLLCSTVKALERRPLRVYGSDIDPAALETASGNLRKAVAETHSPAEIDISLECNPGLLEDLPTGEIDLLLLNPPYVPERQYAGENPYSGTRVIELLLREHGPRVLAPGGVAVMLYSSLATAAVQRCLEESPFAAVSLKRSRRVPLDLREVGSDPRWLDLLRREHDLEETLDDPLHVHWHTLHMLALCRPDDRALIDELRNLAAT